MKENGLHCPHCTWHTPISCHVQSATPANHRGVATRLIWLKFASAIRYILSDLLANILIQLRTPALHVCDVKDAGIPCIIEPSLQLRLDTSEKSEIRIKKYIDKTLRENAKSPNTRNCLIILASTHKWMCFGRNAGLTLRTPPKV